MRVGTAGVSLLSSLPYLVMLYVVQKRGVELSYLQERPSVFGAGVFGRLELFPHIVAPQWIVVYICDVLVDQA